MNVEGQLRGQSAVVVSHTRLVAREAVGRESRACPRACNVDLSAHHSSKKHVHSGADECTGGLVLCSVACLPGVLAPAWSVLLQQQRSVFANDPKISLDREISIWHSSARHAPGVLSDSKLWIKVIIGLFVQENAQISGTMCTRVKPGAPAERLHQAHLAARAPEAKEMWTNPSRVKKVDFGTIDWWWYGWDNSNALAVTAG